MADIPLTFNPYCTGTVRSGSATTSARHLQAEKISKDQGSSRNTVADTKRKKGEKTGNKHKTAQKNTHGRPVFNKHIFKGF